MIKSELVAKLTDSFPYLTAKEADASITLILDKISSQLASHNEHNAVVNAILTGNCEMAYKAMRDHNARLSTSVIRLIKSRQDGE